jgi:alpha-glucosidase
MASNLANIRLRYELSPYYYSLAHLANLRGDPMFPPLVYYFQTDPNVRQIGDEKMIGSQILVAAGPADGPVARDVYLPAGDWVDYRSGKLYRSFGQTFHFDYQANQGLFQLPYLMRSGAILPTLWVDDQTMNVLGRRLDGSVISDLNLKIYPSSKQTAFTVFEDDGQTVAYRKGAVAETKVSQQLFGGVAAIDVMPTSGSFDGAPSSRRVVARVVFPECTPKVTILDGKPLKQFQTRATFENADSGWFWDATAATLILRTPSLPVTQAKQVRIELR